MTPKEPNITGQPTAALSGRKAVRRLGAICALAVLAPHGVSATPADIAITTFNAWCFKAGQTQAQARANTQADSAAFALTFWDASLEPAPATAPYGVERRCQIAFEGDHTAAALAALKQQMAKPPVFGTPTDVPDTHHASTDTTFMQARELLRGRVAVVEIGRMQNPTRTYMRVDRLPTSLAPGDS